MADLSISLQSLVGLELSTRGAGMVGQNTQPGSNRKLLRDFYLLAFLERRHTVLLVG
jgi:hypothetical protein